MKLLQWHRSPIIKGIKKLKEINQGMWRNRIDTAQRYETTPLCNKCGSQVVKLKYRYKLGVDLFKVTCRQCGNIWWATRFEFKAKVSRELLNEAAYRGVSVDDWMEISEIRDAKLKKMGIPRPKRNDYFRYRGNKL